MSAGLWPIEPPMPGWSFPSRSSFHGHFRRPDRRCNSSFHADLREGSIGAGRVIPPVLRAEFPLNKLSVFALFKNAQS